VGIALVAFAYTLLGGLYGVVWTDVLQAGIIGAAAVYLGVLAAQNLSPELLAAWPGAKFNQFVPRLNAPGLAPYQAFGWFLCVWAGKGLLEGLGGSGGSAYMAQRFYAARSDAECQKIGMLWTLLFAFRWPMILGFVVLAVKLGITASSPASAERLLPLVLHSDFFPTGVRGLMLAALLAAAMSTFDSTINAGASYLVKDIYEPWRERITGRELVWAGYAASALIVGMGLLIALWANATILGIWVSIVMLLFPAFLVPFALRWYWGRFNGAGFTAGIGAGFAAALAMFLLTPAGWNEAQRFLVVAGCSLAASLAASVVTPPTPMETLSSFYQQVAPAGWWPRDWRRAHRREHRRDLVRLGVALPWQILTFLLPMGLILRMWDAVVPAAIVWLALFCFLIRDLRLADATAPSTRAINAEAAVPAIPQD
jgi:Na+/proline symporter